MDREFKPAWKQVKRCFKKGSEKKRLEQYSKKEMQSEIYNKQDKKCNMWLEQNLTPRKKISRHSLGHPPPPPFLKGGRGRG